MDIHLLLKRLDGHLLANKARAVIDGKLEILARLDGQDWVYTDKGKALADLHSNLVVEEAAAKPARASKKGLSAVESPLVVESTATEEVPAAE